MDEEKDDYDVFLENWASSPLLNHATLDSNLFDPLVQLRLQSDTTAAGEVPRATNILGTKKSITEQERDVRRFEFFEQSRSSESEEFRERLLGAGIDTSKVDAFIKAMAQDWVDGRKRRQHSPTMERIKASIQQHDRALHANQAGKFVINHVPDYIDPIFDEFEMKSIFRINEDMIERYMADYLEEFPLDQGSSINHIYVRRGVAMPEAPGAIRSELHYLSSFSLALTPVEQFGQILPAQPTGKEFQCIFSAPIPAIQKRIVAFTPFIKGMDISQLEIVVAPPIEDMTLHYGGEFGGMHDYEFA